LDYTILVVYFVVVLYGVVLVITGIVGSHTVKHKAAGINIDLWTASRC